jgi:hypothetical protein
VSFATITLCVASQRVFIVVVVVVVLFLYDSFRKLLDTPTYMSINIGLVVKIIIGVIKARTLDG